MYSNSMRLTGFSGMDIDSMVTKLMKAESAKYNRFQQKTTLTMWRQEQYRSYADKMRKFQADFLDVGKDLNLRFSGTFKTNLTSVTSGTAESKDIKVLSSSGAQAGKYDINVRQLAAKDKYTNSNFEFLIQGNTGFNYQKIAENDSITVTLDGNSYVMAFTDTDLAGVTSNDDFKRLLNTKLDGAFGTGIVKAEFTVDGELKFTAPTGSSLKIAESSRSQKIAAERAFDSSSISSPTTFKFRLVSTASDGTRVGKNIAFSINQNDSLDSVVTSINTEITAKFGAGSEPVKAVNNQGKLTFEKINRDSEVNIRTVVGFENVLQDLGFGSATDPIDSMNIHKVSVLTDMGFALPPGATSLDNSVTTKPLNQLFNNLVESPPGSGIIRITLGDYSGSFTTDAKLSDVIEDVNKYSKYKLTYNFYEKKLALESKEYGVNNAIPLGSNNFLTQNLGFGAGNRTMAQNAIYEVNGQVMTSPTNEILLSDGKLKLELGPESKDKLITVEVKRDTESVIDVIKKFVEGYNTMYSEINKEISTKRPTKNKQVYDPLTDDQRKEMKESEIKSWEEYAKTGLLYQDKMLGKFTSDMRKALYQPVDLGGGKKIALYEIGISTASLSMGKDKMGQLVIDEKKLKEALETRLDDVSELFTKTSAIPYTKYGDPNNNNARRLLDEGLGDRLYDLIEDMAGNRSAIASLAGIKGTMSESTSDMFLELQKNANTLSEMLKSLIKKENNYYSMFSKMEAAMVKSDNQMAYLQQQLAR